MSSVGTQNNKESKRLFLSGYNEMLKRIEPDYIICFGEPFEEMKGNLIIIDYTESRKEVY